MNAQTRLFTKLRWVLLAPALFFFALLPAGARADTDDICGCADSNSLGDFVMSNAGTHPPGTVVVSELQRCSVTLAAPEAGGGFLVFDSMTLDGCSTTTGSLITGGDPNPGGGANLGFDWDQPVVLMVKGDVVIDVNIDLLGEVGEKGQSSTGGRGGTPGPGGFVGGRGAGLSEVENSGAAGIGPGGGLGGSVTNGQHNSAGGGQWVGVSELRPLIGGGGGGGGYAESAGTLCTGGGGGGGGGALLIAANGTIDLKEHSYVRAKGGNGGSRGSGSCSSSGGGGSGGAIRLVAKKLDGDGTISVKEGAGGQHPGGNSGTAGQVRIESKETDDFTGTIEGNVSREASLSPLQNPVSPAVRIIAINSDEDLLPESFSGAQGRLDVTLQAAGEITFALESTDVPSGTLLEVKATPDAGGAPQTEEKVIDPTHCTGGVCDTEITLTLASGFYIVEARATFQVAESSP